MGDKAGTCTCDHLTSFMITLRQYSSANPTCAATLPSILLAISYGLVAITAFAQASRAVPAPSRKSLGAKKPPKCDILRLNHVGVGVICLLRIVVLIFSNLLLATSAAVVVVMASFPTLLEHFVFGALAVQWANAGLFAMNPVGRRKLSKAVKAVLFLLVLITFIFPMLLLSLSERAEQEVIATAGAYCMGSATDLVGVAVAVFGACLVKALGGAASAKSGGGGGNLSKSAAPSTKRDELQSRLKKAVLAFCLCFAAQGVLHILSVQSNALNDETTAQVLPLLFGAFDLFVLCSLLLLLSVAVEKRFKARGGGGMEDSDSKFPSSFRRSQKSFKQSTHKLGGSLNNKSSSRLHEPEGERGIELQVVKLEEPAQQREANLQPANAKADIMEQDMAVQV